MTLLAILAGLAASTPTAADVFQTFEALCLSTGASPAAAVAKASAQGWTEIPAEVDKAGPQAIRARAITQFNVHDLSRGVALQIIIPVR